MFAGKEAWALLAASSTDVAVVERTLVEYEAKHGTNPKNKINLCILDKVKRKTNALLQILTRTRDLQTVHDERKKCLRSTSYTMNAVIQAFVLEEYKTYHMRGTPTNESRIWNATLVFSFLGYIKNVESDTSPDEVRTFRGLYDSEETDEWQIVPICDFGHVFHLLGERSKGGDSNDDELRLHLNVGRRILDVLCSFDFADTSEEHLRSLKTGDRYVIRYLLSDTARLSAAINCAHWLGVKDVRLVSREQVKSLSQFTSLTYEYGKCEYDEIYLYTILRVQKSLSKDAELLIQGYEEELLSVQEAIVIHPGIKLYAELRATVNGEPPRNSQEQQQLALVAAPTLGPSSKIFEVRDGDDVEVDKKLDNIFEFVLGDIVSRDETRESVLVVTPLVQQLRDCDKASLKNKNVGQFPAFRKHFEAIFSLFLDDSTNHAMYGEYVRVVIKIWTNLLTSNPKEAIYMMLQLFALRTSLNPFYDIYMLNDRCATEYLFKNERLNIPYRMPRADREAEEFIYKAAMKVAMLRVIEDVHDHDSFRVELINKIHLFVADAYFLKLLRSVEQGNEQADRIAKIRAYYEEITTAAERSSEGPAGGQQAHTPDADPTATDLAPLLWPLNQSIPSAPPLPNSLSTAQDGGIDSQEEGIASQEEGIARQDESNDGQDEGNDGQDGGIGSQNQDILNMDLQEVANFIYNGDSEERMSDADPVNPALPSWSGDLRDFSASPYNPSLSGPADPEGRKRCVSTWCEPSINQRSPDGDSPDESRNSQSPTALPIAQSQCYPSSVPNRPGFQGLANALSANMRNPNLSFQDSPSCTGSSQAGAWHQLQYIYGTPSPIPSPENAPRNLGLNDCAQLHYEGNSLNSSPDSLHAQLDEDLANAQLANAQLANDSDPGSLSSAPLADAPLPLFSRSTDQPTLFDSAFFVKFASEVQTAFSSEEACPNHLVRNVMKFVQEDTFVSKLVTHCSDDASLALRWISVFHCCESRTNESLEWTYTYPFGEEKERLPIHSTLVDGFVEACTTRLCKMDPTLVVPWAAFECASRIGVVSETKESALAGLEYLSNLTSNTYEYGKHEYAEIYSFTVERIKRSILQNRHLAGATECGWERDDNCPQPDATSLPEPSTDAIPSAVDNASKLPTQQLSEDHIESIFQNGRSFHKKGASVVLNTVYDHLTTFEGSADNNKSSVTLNEYKGGYLSEEFDPNVFLRKLNFDNQGTDWLQDFANWLEGVMFTIWQPREDGYEPRRASPTVSSELDETVEDVVDLSDLANAQIGVGDRPSSKRRVEICRLKSAVNALVRCDRKAIMVRYSSPYAIGAEYTMEARHFFILLNKRWLDDTIMNAYYVLLSDKLHREKKHELVLLHTHVHSLLSTKVSDGDSAGVDTHFDARARFYLSAVLVNGNHWISVLVDVVDAKAYVYDSLYLESASYSDSIMHGLRGILRTHRKKAGVAYADDRGPALSYIKKAPKQKNCRDCGMYALAFAHAQVGAVRGRSLRMGADVEHYGRENLAASLQRTYVP
ncbi:hypothetical protein CYMTET_3878 [Cymbomonas tetramitiformis]|uniref:Ubiquitin-like protease family profile domain-containing protein n=1 Tax=Cymbomonas tetramitiformis TaxID=36881 RepID=A0AAE0H2R6_9CHLO|nr:hypothetical protein CYMTET_3878 [Cymbomonas tetramitiformis]